MEGIKIFQLIKRSIFLAILVTLIVSTGYALTTPYGDQIPSPSGQSEMSVKLDSELNRIVGKIQTTPTEPTTMALAPSVMSIQPEEMIPVFIKTKYELNESHMDKVKDLGGNFVEIGNSIVHFGKFYEIEIPTSAINALTNLEFILYVEYGLHENIPTLDVSAPRIGAPIVWSKTDDWGKSIKGDGIIIADIDTGIDYTNPMFKYPNGSSKIRKIWDQTTEEICNRSQIEDATCNQKDNGTYGGHGTHVSGIILGGNSGDTYIGVAPDAKLLMIKTTQSDAAVVNGIYWAVSEGAEVIIIELQSWTNRPRDGSSAVEGAIDWATSQNVTVVVPAGNLGGTGYHSSPIANNGSFTLFRFSLSSSSGIDMSILWRNPDTNLGFWFQPPGASSAISLGSLNNPEGCTTHSETGIYYCPSSTISDRGTAEFDFKFIKSSGLPTGTWNLWVDALNYPILSSQQVEAYVSCCGSFMDYMNDNYVVAHPATADTSISVANYVSKNNWTDNSSTYQDQSWNIGDMAPSSPTGPRIDGMLKPEISAPGSEIVSARSSDASYSSRNIIDDNHVILGGTSMAGPHVAGATALLLQQDPTLLPYQIKNIFYQTAESISSCSSQYTCGYGLIRSDNAYTRNDNLYFHDPSPTIVNRSVFDVSSYFKNNDTVSAANVTINMTLLNSTGIKLASGQTGSDYISTYPAGTDWLVYYTLNATQDGNYSVRFDMKSDNMGNDFIIINFSVDTTPPTITISTPANGTTLVQNWAYVYMTANESLSTAILEWNGTNESMSGSGMNWYRNKTSLANGVYTFRVWGRDLAGNWNVSETRTVTVLFVPIAKIVERLKDGHVYVLYDSDKQFDIVKARSVTAANGSYLNKFHSLWYDFLKENIDNVTTNGTHITLVYNSSSSSFTVPNGTEMPSDVSPYDDILKLNVRVFINGSNIDFQYLNQNIDDDWRVLDSGDVALTSTSDAWDEKWLVGGTNNLSATIDVGEQLGGLNHSGYLQSTNASERYGIRYDATGDGDVDDSDDYTIYNDIKIVDRTLTDITIKPAMRIGNASYLDDRVFKLKGQKYLVYAYADAENKVELVPVTRKNLVNATTTGGIIDSSVTVPGTDVRVGLTDYRVDLNQAKFAIIEGGAITEYIVRDSGTSPALSAATDQELINGYYIYPTKLESTYMELTIGKIADKFGIYDGDTDVLGYAKAVVNDDDGWTTFGTDDNEFRLEDNNITVANGSKEQIGSTNVYAKYDQDKMFDLVKKMEKSVASGSKLKATIDPWDDFLQNIAGAGSNADVDIDSVAASGSNITFRYKSQDIDDNWRVTDNDDFNLTGTTDGWAGKWLVADLFVNGLIDCGEQLCGYNATGYLQSTNASEKYGIRYDATGDGDVADSDDYSVYNDILIVDRTLTDITIKPAMRIGNASFLVGKTFKIKGNNYTLLEFNDAWNRVILRNESNSQNITITDGDINVLGYAKAVVDDDDGWTVGGTDDNEFRLEDNVITIPKDSYANLTVLPAAGFIEASVQLVPGWNMVSLPLIPENMSVASVFGSIPTLDIRPVVTWQRPSFVEVQDLEPKRGYWVFTPAATTINITGQAITDKTISLAAGWNMVGTTGTTALNLTAIPNQMPQLRPPVTWVKPSFVETSTVEPGKAAWVFVITDTEAEI